MPYVSPEIRDELDRARRAQTPGELNYVLTLEIIEYLEEKGLSYQTINDIMGALEGAKAEFYRRVAIPYENDKIEENGDVYVTDANGHPYYPK